jgi:hypothetical protein
MRDKGGLHKKVQELVDCFATTDPLKEMSGLKKEKDENEAALKWLALAVLHGINMNAKEITIKRSRNGKVAVTAKYREAELPSPGTAIGEKVFAAVQGITHLERSKDKTMLALGVRDGSIEIKVEIKKGEEKEEVSFGFPE